MIRFRRVIFPLVVKRCEKRRPSRLHSVALPLHVDPFDWGNRVITLGTAIEQHFLVTQNWGMGSTIGVILIIAMFLVMLFTEKKKEGNVNEKISLVESLSYSSVFYSFVRADLLFDFRFLQ